MTPRHRHKVNGSWTRNKIIRSILLWSGMVIMSWINATNFDRTELKFLGEMAILWTTLQKALPD